nr:uncharacterized protein LOC110375857 [Helicoverpa armigera]
MYALRTAHYGPTEGLVDDDALPRICVPATLCLIRDFSMCHDDFDSEPADGVLKEHTFKWVGFMQYIHVTTGFNHHSKAPRVVLVHKQFALGTAASLATLPKNYKPGNVIFGDYERDEADCGISREQLKMGLRCARAYIEIPAHDVTPHPEYTRFGISNSLALVRFIRPLRSHYMSPVCLPSLTERARKKNNRNVFLVDYISTVPRDFEFERLAKKTLKLYTHRQCKRHRAKAKLGSEGVSNALCTSGCGVRPGAPIISHAVDGAYELIGIAVGGSPCTRRSMRRRLNVEPPIYIDVYPYVAWIMNVIMAFQVPNPYPLNVMQLDSGPSVAINRSFLRKRKREKSGWRSRTFMSGNLCFKSLRKQKKAAFFYSERFEVNAEKGAKLNVIMKLSAGIECTIVCARLLLPSRLTEPTITGVGTYNITIRFDTEWFPYSFYFALALDGQNTTTENFHNWLPDRKHGFW